MRQKTPSCTTRWFKLQVAAAVCASTALCSTAMPARADTGTDVGRFLSDSGNIAYLIAGVGLPYFEDGANGKNHSLRALDSVATTVILTEGIKRITNERRPDKSDHESFPSGHASAAFSVASMESAFHPKQAIFWYTGAALISASRVTLHRHYIHDVLAGGLLGYGISRLELSRRHGILLFPFIGQDTGGQGGGVRVSLRF